MIKQRKGLMNPENSYYTIQRCDVGKCNLHGRAVIMIRCFMNLEIFNFHLTN